jgi:hypothetical protein
MRLGNSQSSMVDGQLLRSGQGDVSLNNSAIDH